MCPPTCPQILQDICLWMIILRKLLIFLLVIVLINNRMASTNNSSATNVEQNAAEVQTDGIELGQYDEEPIAGPSYWTYYHGNETGNQSADDTLNSSQLADGEIRGPAWSFEMVDEIARRSWILRIALETGDLADHISWQIENIYYTGPEDDDDDVQDE